jgi:hypothetical protein
VAWTTDLDRALELNVRERIARLEGQFSAELVLRSAVWLSVKESRASFVIEHEKNQLDRIQRFAAVMEQRVGQLPDPLNVADLESLQREILGHNALHYGLRSSPVFVGESDRFGQEIVHYVGPHWDDVPAMLGGLREVLGGTTGLSPRATRPCMSPFASLSLQKQLAVSINHARSFCQVRRSAASRSNRVAVFSRTSVNGRPVRRVVWRTGKS